MCIHNRILLVVASLLSIAGVVFIPTIALGGSFNSKSFGGKILTTSIPPVTCIPTITGPVVLNSNIGRAVTSAIGTGLVASLPTHSGKNTDGMSISKGGKAGLVAAGAVSTIYNTIPYAVFTGLNPQKTSPTMGSWILGKSGRIPSFTDCWIQAGPYRIPFPVIEVGMPPPGNYNVSKTPSF